MKKLLVILLALAMLFSFAACDTTVPEDEGNSNIIAEATATPTAEPTPEPTPEPISGKTVTFEKISLVVPEGYTETELNGLKLLYTDDFPTVADSITFAKSAADSISAYSKEVFETQYSQSLEGFTGIDVYEEIKIDGVDTLKVGVKLETGGVKLVQTQYFMFFSDMSIVIGFAEVEGSPNSAEFAEIVKSIKVAK